MSEVIPEGWSLEPLASCIAESIAGEWGSDANGDSNDIPVLRSTNFTNSGKIDYTKIVYRNIDARKRVKKKLNKGDIVLEKSGGSPTQPVGRVVYFDRDTPFLYSNFTQKLVVQQGHDQKYVFYKFLAAYEDGTVLKFQQQTTGIINFQLSEYLLYQTPLAPLPEQQKIATILSSVDDVIEKTRAQIDKLKDLKTGMMQELLTQGIGHTEFKDSPIGSIPASWDVYPISMLLSERKEKGLSGLPIYSVFIDGGMVPRNSVDRRVLSEMSDSDNKLARKGDMVYNMMRMWQGALGIAPVDCLISPAYVICKISEKLDPDFLYFLLKTPSSIKKLEAYSQGLTNDRLRLYFESFQKIIFAIPKKEEQKKIATTIRNIEDFISSKKIQLNKYENLKKSLMTDLLTGKVRIKVNPTETAAA